jgi:hypothetical protein
MEEGAFAGDCSMISQKLQTGTKSRHAMKTKSEPKAARTLELPPNSVEVT